VATDKAAIREALQPLSLTARTCAATAAADMLQCSLEFCSVQSAKALAQKRRSCCISARLPSVNCQVSAQGYQQVVSCSGKVDV
jgi:hypothetical protein